mmetsp:Transcript_5925/g.10299  ORF Transcript_5925/g.10299 Transcript_5925/m.10299 type:complete len:672 (+) Transcript_5925:419-2434(+)
MDVDWDISRVLSGGGFDGFTFWQLYAALVFLVALWFAGKAVQLVGMPALIGEIITGIILGPYLLDYVPMVGGWKLIGEIGLMLLVIEAGLDVDLEMLRVIGFRGAAIAVIGSIIPLSIGFLLAYFVLNQDVKASFAVGAALAPTSMGIALNVLRAGRLLNTPVGQLVISAAVLDDIIALVLLSELQALEDPTAWAFVKPVIVAVLLLVAFGCFAIYVVPVAMHKVIFPRVPDKKHENLTLGLIFALALGLAPLANAAGSSYLLGCFIAGVCFCTETIVHHVWVAQVKRVLCWLLRIFFACTIGFEIPVKKFGNPTVIAHGFLLLIAITGKLATGLLVRPFIKFDALVVSFAMAAWGEFAFIVILYAKDNGIVGEDLVASVILAILISIIASPALLRCVINYFTTQVKAEVVLAMEDTGEGAHGEPPLYYFIQSRSAGGWGQQQKLLRAIMDSDLHIIDMRSFHPHHNNLDVKVVYEMYLKDNKMTLPVADYREPNPSQAAAIDSKLEHLHSKVLHALNDPNAIARVGRWYAGIHPDQEKPNFDFTEESFHSPRQDLHKRVSESETELSAERIPDRDEEICQYLDGFVHKGWDDLCFSKNQKENDLEQQKPRQRMEIKRPSVINLQRSQSQETCKIGVMTNPSSGLLEILKTNEPLSPKKVYSASDIVTLDM